MGGPSRLLLLHSVGSTGRNHRCYWYPATGAPRLPGTHATATGGRRSASGVLGENAVQADIAETYKSMLFGGVLRTGIEVLLHPRFALRAEGVARVHANKFSYSKGTGSWGFDGFDNFDPFAPNGRSKDTFSTAGGRLGIVGTL